jgi:hypothetical protein
MRFVALVIVFAAGCSAPAAPPMPRECTTASCQKHLEIGDSLRDSGNHAAARDAYADAVDADAACEVCKSRLQAAEARVQSARDAFEGAGVLHLFEKGDYERTFDAELRRARKRELHHEIPPEVVAPPATPLDPPL